MIEPYVYWRFDTPLAYIIGLYTNVVNGGMLTSRGAIRISPKAHSINGSCMN